MINVALTIVFVIIFFGLRMMLIEGLAGFFADRRFWRAQRRHERALRNIRRDKR